MERGLGVREAAESEFGKQGPVELFGEVVAPLVGGVDATLDSGEDRIGSAGGAGLIFNVPEFKVGAVLRGDEGEPVAGGFGESRFDMPLACESIVEFDDLGCGENGDPNLC
jgi:hypothetical protein